MYLNEGCRMFLEKRMVSRKTPHDGKLEISERAAASIPASALELDLLVNGVAGRGSVTTMRCTCRGSGDEHIHYFLQSELLKALRADTEVLVNVPDGDEPVVVASS